jgi:hypothetical protein
VSDKIDCLQSQFCGQAKDADEGPTGDLSTFAVSQFGKCVQKLYQLLELNCRIKENPERYLEEIRAGASAIPRIPTWPVCNSDLIDGSRFVNET